MTEEQQFKYIAVRGWAKYQGRMKFTKGAKRDKIWQAAALDSDPDYSRLTFFQRETLNGLRRLTALHGHNPYNDPTTLARQLCALATDRPHLPHAISTLVVRGLLILTNEKDPFHQSLLPASDVMGCDVMGSDNKERDREEAASPSASQVPEPQSNPVNGGDSVPSTPVGQESPPVVEVERLCEVLSNYSGLNVTEEWRKYARLILKRAKGGLPAMESLLVWMFEEDDFWGKCTHNMENLHDRLEKGNLLKKYNAHKSHKKKRAAKQGSALVDGATKRGDTIATRKESEI